MADISSDNPPIKRQKLSTQSFVTVESNSQSDTLSLPSCEGGNSGSSGTPHTDRSHIKNTPSPSIDLESQAMEKCSISSESSGSQDIIAESLSFPFNQALQSLRHLETNVWRPVELPQHLLGLRNSLVNKMVDIHSNFHFQSLSIFLTVSYIDNFLCQYPRCHEDILFLIGTTALMVATKLDEQEHSRLRVEHVICLSYGSYRGSDVVKMEQLIVESLQYNLSLPTAFHFLSNYLEAYSKATGEPIEAALRLLSMYYLESSLVQYRCSNQLPSALAAGAIFAALSCREQHLYPVTQAVTPTSVARPYSPTPGTIGLRVAGNVGWSPVVVPDDSPRVFKNTARDAWASVWQPISGVSMHCARTVAGSIIPYVPDGLSLDPKYVPAVYKKYSKDRFLQVAHLRLPSL